MSLGEEHRIRINELVFEILKEITTTLRDVHGDQLSTGAFVANFLMTVMQVQMAIGQEALEAIAKTSIKLGSKPITIGRGGKLTFDLSENEDERRKNVVQGER